jgi:hypothetical protein
VAPGERPDASLARYRGHRGDLARVVRRQSMIQCRLASLIWEGSGVLDLREARIVVTFRRAARKSDRGLSRPAWYRVIRGSRLRAGARGPRPNQDHFQPGGIAPRTAAARQPRCTRRRAAAATGHRGGASSKSQQQQRVSDAARTATTRHRRCTRRRLTAATGHRRDGGSTAGSISESATLPGRNAARLKLIMKVGWPLPGLGMGAPGRGVCPGFPGVRGYWREIAGQRP